MIVKGTCEVDDDDFDRFENALHRAQSFARTSSAGIVRLERDIALSASHAILDRISFHFCVFSYTSLAHVLEE